MTEHIVEIKENIAVDDSVDAKVERVTLDGHATKQDVGDLLNLSSLGSQATLHSRLKNLHSIGYIELEEQEDGRKKGVTPTNQAYKRIALLSDCTIQATQ